MNKISNKEAIKYLLSLILIIAVGLVFFFVLFPKSNPETTAHGFGGLVVNTGTENNIFYIILNGVPILDDSTIEPPKNLGERKIIIDAKTQIEKNIIVLPTPSQGQTMNVNISELEHKIIQGSIDDLRKGREVLVFVEENIYFEKEFRAKKMTINLFESFPSPQSQ